MFTDWPSPGVPRPLSSPSRPFPALPSWLLFSPVTWATTAGRSSSPRSSSTEVGPGREAWEPAFRLILQRCQEESRVPGQSWLALCRPVVPRLSSPVLSPLPLQSGSLGWRVRSCGAEARRVGFWPAKIEVGRRKRGAGGRRRSKKSQVSCLLAASW